MRATDERVREASGILAQRFSAYLGTFTKPVRHSIARSEL
jgi:hypothetical protein